MKLRIISLIKFFIKFILGNNVCALSLFIIISDFIYLRAFIAATTKIMLLKEEGEMK